MILGKKVVVVMPAYNAEKYIARAIESVLHHPPLPLVTTGYNYWRWFIAGIFYTGNQIFDHLDAKVFEIICAQLKYLGSGSRSRFDLPAGLL